LFGWTLTQVNLWVVCISAHATMSRTGRYRALRVQPWNWTSSKGLWSFLLRVVLDAENARA
jgi:hypothetical protein